MFRHLKSHPQGAHCALLKLHTDFGLYFNNFILPRTKNLHVILTRHIELSEDDILDAETCRIMLFVIIVFDIIVQSLVK